MISRLKKRLPAAGSLGGRALRAGSWNLFQTLGLSVLKLCSNLIMTRLLLPDAFALLSFVFLIYTALALVTDVGIRQSIIREPDGDQLEFLHTAWVFKILRGVLIGIFLLCCALVLWLTAPFWAPEETVYADPRLPGLVVAGALIPLLMGLQSSNRELNERQLDFKPWALLELSATAISIVCMIAFAQISATVWALMAGLLMAFVVKAVGSHMFLPGPRMRWHWNRELAARIWHFGKWLIGSSTFTFVGRNADKIIFGALLHISTMGLLTVAYVWVTAGRLVVEQLLGKVAYPLLSEIKRERAADMTRLLARVQRMVDVMCVAAFLAAAFIGPPFVRLLYTETYHMAGYFVSMLSLSFLCLRFEILSSLLLTLGDSRGSMWLWAQRGVFLTVLLPLCYTQFGLSAALILTAMHSLVSLPFVLYRLGDNLSQYARLEAILWALAILALGAGFVVWSPLS